MRMVIPFLGLEAKLVENQNLSICIENPETLARICQDVFLQCNGEDGEILISENDKVITLSKSAVYIANPFGVNCNEKKVISKIYQELGETVRDCCNDEINNINSQIMCMFDNILEKSPYALSYNFELDANGLFKLYDIKFSQVENDICTLLTDYLRVISKVLGIKIVFFVNLKMYLSEDQYLELCKFSAYLKIYVIDICGFTPYKIETEKVYIADKDLCIIEL